MKKSPTHPALVFFALLLLGLSGCNALQTSSSDVADPIVGTWIVKDPNAPFPFHMYVFNSDRTMQQANPDAGDAHGSDSDGKGIWVPDGDRIKGKWVEVIADRTTHKFAGRLEISYQIKVSGDTFVGTESVRYYDADGKSNEGPATPGQIEGKRVTLP
jgi:hypothetical protein